MKPSGGEARKVLLAALKVQAAAEAEAFMSGGAGIPTDLPVVRDGDRILRADGQFADDLSTPPEWEPWMGWEAQQGWDE